MRAGAARRSTSARSRLNRPPRPLPRRPPTRPAERPAHAIPCGGKGRPSLPGPLSTGIGIGDRHRDGRHGLPLAHGHCGICEAGRAHESHGAVGEAVAFVGILRSSGRARRRRRRRGRPPPRRRGRHVRENHAHGAGGGGRMIAPTTPASPGTSRPPCAGAARRARRRLPSAGPRYGPRGPPPGPRTRARRHRRKWPPVRRP